jgi:hypothetical protein
MVSRRMGATIPRMPSPRRAVVLLLAALAVGACDPAVPPSPSATGSPTTGPTSTPRESASPGASTGPSASAGGEQAIYREIEGDVVTIRGLEPKADVEPQLLTEDELKERTETSFREDNPEELVRANEVLLRALGLLDADASLTDLYVELLGSQVAGFYDPEVDELFVVARSGGLNVAERVTFAHEYTHALQDQHFDLEGFALDEIGQGDRSLGGLALIEGDATTVMSYWAQQHLTPEETLELLRSSLDPEQLAILERMPPILRETLEFPYQSGLAFVMSFQTPGGWDAVDALYDKPPVSTEQILHPEKYQAGEAPVSVDLPDDLAARMGQGWSVTLEDTFGEFQTQVWLRTALRRVAPGNEAAAGWGGDRLAVLEGPDGAWALIWRTVWDDEDEATEFEAAASEAIDAGPYSGTVLVDGTEASIVIAPDRSLLNEAVGAAGFVVAG